jgi:hypothetical protein
MVVRSPQEAAQTVTGYTIQMCTIRGGIRKRFQEHNSLTPPLTTHPIAIIVEHAQFSAPCTTKSKSVQVAIT